MSNQPKQYSFGQKLFAEFLGSVLLLSVIIGSGIMGDALSAGAHALALLANSISVGCALIVLITIFAPISGAHFNPAVTILMFLRKQIDLKNSCSYIIVQIAGAIVGAMLAHLMFDLPIVQTSQTIRTGTGQWIAESVATFGLLATILAGLRFKPDQIPLLVGLYIISAFWFTASTSFANPSVTIGRLYTDTFSGIYPGNVAYFIIAQIVAVPVAIAFDHLCLTPDDSDDTIE